MIAGVVIICIVFCCLLPICVICLTVALCCTCRKYRKAQREAEGEKVEAPEPKRSVVRQGLPAVPSATNATVMTNESMARQESGLYDYIPDVPLHMEDNRPYNVPANVNQRDIKVQQNTTYVGSNLDTIAVQQNTAYVTSEPDTPAVEEDTTYLYVTQLTPSRNNVVPANVDQRDIEVKQNSAYVDSKLGTRAVQQNVAYVASELSTLSVEENAAYNYGQPIPTPNVAYETHNVAGAAGEEEEDHYYY